MEEEIIKIKYRYLHSKLDEISFLLDMINCITKDIGTSLEKSILIDNRIVEEDQFDAIIDKQYEIYAELKLDVLPVVINRSF